MVSNSGNSHSFKGLNDKLVHAQLFIYLFPLTVWLFVCVRETVSVCPCVLQAFKVFHSFHRRLTYCALVPFQKAAKLFVNFYKLVVQTEASRSLILGGN